MKMNNISLENHPELFETFDDSVINYIMENIETITDEEFQEIVKRDLTKQ